MRTRAAVAALLCGAVLAGCSSSRAPAPASSPGGSAAGAPGSAGPSASVTRWWSAPDYCGILRQTVAAGHSILPGAKAGDPQLLGATKAFVASVTGAAPDEVRAHWQVLGPAITQLVESGGKPGAMSGVNTRLVAQAATAIAADAKSRCHLDLSS